MRSLFNGSAHQGRKVKEAGVWSSWSRDTQNKGQKVMNSHCCSVPFISLSRIPARGMVPPRVGRSSHRNSHNQDNPHRRAQQPVSSEILDFYQLYN